VRIEVDLESLPLADGVADVAAQLGVPAYELAATGARISSCAPRCASRRRPSWA
jgi:hydrogenase maturation factor